MFTSRFAVHSITALVMCGLILQLTQADQIKNAKCITLLQPATCSSIGNSICQAVAAGGNCAAKACTFCDDPNKAVANQICVNWENLACTKDPNQQSKSCDNTANYMTGTCGLNQSCLCLNQNQNGQCGNNTLAQPCTTP